MDFDFLKNNKNNEKDENKGKNKNENKNEMFLILQEMQEDRKLLTQSINNQTKIIEDNERIKKEQTKMKEDIADLKNFKENEARIRPAEQNQIKKNSSKAVYSFAKDYGFDMTIWGAKLFKAHNTYIADTCEAPSRAEILLKHKDKALKISQMVNINYWKVQSILTEYAINDGMPIKWENKAEENDYFEIIKAHLENGDLEEIIKKDKTQIFDEVAKRKLLRENAKRRKKNK